MLTSVQRIIDLFRGSELHHGTHGMPELDDNGVKWAIKRTARTLKGSPTKDLWLQHLEGKLPLGVIPIRDDSTCYWGSVDIDDYDVDALAVINRIDKAKLPLVPCRSKSGGLHLFMFFKDAMDAAIVQGLLREIAASLGYAGSEIFPKQTKFMVDKGDAGNWMVMPYYGGDFDGKLRFQYGLKKSGAEMTLEEFVSHAEKKRLSRTDVDDLKVQLVTSGNGDAHKKNGKSKEKEPFSDGPPCLQHMARSGFPDGGRNNALFHIGVFLRRAHPEDWEARLEQDNARFMLPPLPSDEVQGVIRSLKKKDYEYKCKDQPMEKHCDPVKCRSRKFGVSGGAYPVIESMRKLLTEPPLYFVDIPGSTVMLTTEQLTDYKKFLNACIAASNVGFRLITPQLWNMIYTEALQKCEDIPAPPETRRPGMFAGLMSTFLTNRTIGDKKEDLLRNVPWDDEENGRFVFKLESLKKFIKSENIKEFNNNELPWFLKNMGAVDAKMDIKGQRNQRVWEIPKKNVEVAPELDPPTEEKELI